MSHVRRLVPALAGLALLVGAAGCGEEEPSSSSGQDSASVAASDRKKDRYTMYLSNSYLGEGWRTQMVKSAQAVTNHEPLKGRVDLEVVTSEQNTPSSQIQSLNNIILRRPDAILLNPSSPPALKPVLERACRQDILIVSFDQVVDASCAYNVHVDFPSIGRAQAQWLAETLDGRGGVLQDQGLPGTTISSQLVESQREVIEQHPEMRILDTFTSEFAPGPEQRAVSSLLAAHRDVDGLLSQGYVSGSFSAFENANRDVVPFAAFAYNGPMSDCATTEGAECFLMSAPPWQSASAMKIAVDVLDGKDVPRDTVIPSDCFSTNDIAPEGMQCERIEVDKNAFPDLSPDIVLPVSPPWTDLTLEEVAGDV
jgi:ribose transport system substrate-binding protein